MRQPQILKSQKLGLVLRVYFPEVACNYPLNSPEDALPLLKELEKYEKTLRLP